MSNERSSRRAVVATHPPNLSSCSMRWTFSRASNLTWAFPPRSSIAGRRSVDDSQMRSGFGPWV